MHDWQAGRCIAHGSSADTCSGDPWPQLTASAVDDRRQRAREAFWDTSGGLMSGARDGVETCIETATRVRITPEVMAAAAGAGIVPAGMPREQQRRALAVIFAAAGFEIEE